MCGTTGEHTNGVKVEDKDGVLVASTDIDDGNHRTIILKYMPDGTIAIDCENDPQLIEQYRDQINAIIEQNRSPLIRTLPDMATMFAGLGLGKEFTASSVLGRLNRSNYSPCIECGKKTKGGHCFRCRSSNGQ